MSYKDNGFPVKKGQMQLESGVISGYVGVMWNVDSADGSLTITFTDDTTVTANVPAGGALDCTLSGIKSVEIVSGIFHRA